MAKKKKDLSTAAGIQQWMEECQFESQIQAAAELGVPHRTFVRWLSEGMPGTRPASIRYREFIVAKMEEILANRLDSR